MRVHQRTLWVILAALWSVTAFAAPAAEPWPRWELHDPESTRIIDHSAWTRILERYVRQGDDGIARFAYAAVTQPDRANLDAYIDRLAATDIDAFDRDRQRAFWINLYNALTIDVVLEHYPVDSIRDIDISPGLFSNGPWGAELVTVNGIDLTLDQIEHRILRPIWGDPRIHYAVNCASLGCPDLRPVAFTAANTDELLTSGARAYVNHPRGVAFVEGELVVSSIYEWFQADFGGSEPGVMNHLEKYAQPGLRERLAQRERHDHHRYDWALNGVP